MYVHIFLGHHAGVRCDQRENIREHQELDQKHRRGTVAISINGGG